MGHFLAAVLPFSLMIAIVSCGHPKAADDNHFVLSEKALACRSVQEMEKIDAMSQLSPNDALLYASRDPHCTFLRKWTEIEYQTDYTGGWVGVKTHSGDWVIGNGVALHK